MRLHNLRAHLSVLLLLVGACSSNEEPGATDPGSTGVATTGSSTGEGPTTSGTPTTGEATTGGVSESLGGTTGESTGTSTGDATTGAVDESTGSSGEATDASSETGASTGEGESTGDPVVPVGFAECREGDATMCPAEDPACLVVEGPGGFGPDGSFFVTWSYCTRECEDDADCVSGIQGGTAKPRCVAKGPNMVKVCVLDCSFGKTCPDKLECSYDDTCATRFCDCEGDGCQDMLCTG